MLRVPSVGRKSLEGGLASEILTAKIWLVNRLAAGGSRGITAGDVLSSTSVADRSLWVMEYTLGHSREPPASNRQNCEPTKRLPSERWSLDRSID